MKRSWYTIIGLLVAFVGYVLWLYNPHSFIWLTTTAFIPFTVGEVGLMEGLVLFMSKDRTKMRRGFAYLILGDFLVLSSARTTAFATKCLNYPVDWAIQGAVFMAVAIYLLWFGVDLIARGIKGGAQ